MDYSEFTNACYKLGKSYFTLQENSRLIAEAISAVMESIRPIMDQLLKVIHELVEKYLEYIKEIQPEISYTYTPYVEEYHDMSRYNGLSNKDPPLIEIAKDNFHYNINRIKSSKAFKCFSSYSMDILKQLFIGIIVSLILKHI